MYCLELPYRKTFRTVTVCLNRGGPACVNTGAVTNPLEMD
jgi:hypothetical protein